MFETMKNPLFTYIPALLLALTYMITLVQETSDDELITSYLLAQCQTMHGESTAEDVETLLALFTDDIVYEHPKVGIKLESKDVLREGKLNFLASYGGTEDNTTMELVSKITNNEVVIIKFNASFFTNSGEQLNRTQTQVLEIDEGKISRIIDYWD